MDEHRLDIDTLQSLERRLPLDDIFDVLSDDCARYTLNCLDDQPTIALEQLADVVAGMRATATDTVTTPSEHERIRIRLYHVSLPKLESLEFIEYDVDTRMVTRANVPPDVYGLLDIDQS
ncbi:hypothetical protein ACLI4Q_17310 [Natrialbaceae archaeon A-CW1-1]